MKNCSVRMFAGKGGVGKTTSSAATALHCATAGMKTLAISTDATPSLSHIFEAGKPQMPARVAERLYFQEIGLNEIKAMWDRKFGPEVHEVFASIVDVDYPQFVEFMTSLLPGLGDEFMVDYIRELALSGEYETIIWDTAPLGQTLALLQTPAMLARHLKMAPRIYSRLKVGRNSREPIIDILKRWQALSDENIAFLKTVSFNLVTIPEALAVEQIDGIMAELGAFGFKTGGLVVNNVIKSRESPFLESRASQQARYLELIHGKYGHLKITEVPLFAYEIKGLERLAEAENALFREP